MDFTLIVIGLLTLQSSTTYSLPFVVFHGISDKCSNGGVAQFTDLLSNWSGSSGHCIEIGNGEWDSWFMPFSKQVDIACEKLKKMSMLSEGYNIIGLSQGNLVGRGVVEFCDGGPPVRNLISLGGPHAGIASVPFCGSGTWCILADSLLKLVIYSNFIQEHLAPAGYIKIPTDIADYRKGCKFLPVLNNEVHRNSTYKKRFASLENLVLIMFEKDEILVPKQTSWFGYYPDGSFSTVLPAWEVIDKATGKFYELFQERNIDDLEEFHLAILDMFDIVNSSLPGKRRLLPPFHEIKACYEKVKDLDEEAKKKVVLKFMKEKIQPNEADKSLLIIGLATPPAAMVAKKAGEGVPQLKFIKSVPDVLFVPAATLLVLVSVKFSRRLSLQDAASEDV